MVNVWLEPFPYSKSTSIGDIWILHVLTDDDWMRLTSDGDTWLCAWLMACEKKSLVITGGPSGKLLASYKIVKSVTICFYKYENKSNFFKFIHLLIENIHEIKQPQLNTKKNNHLHNNIQYH
jgi:hypothetical protein